MNIAALIKLLTLAVAVDNLATKLRLLSIVCGNWDYKKSFIRISWVFTLRSCLSIKVNE